MTDIVDSQTRSRMMAGIRAKDTKPELVLRKSLHALGFRYRLHSKDLPGRPDLVLPKYKAVIFIHGCFWHRHESCRYASQPRTRTEFWAAKFDANVARDKAACSWLIQMGWRVAVVWECTLRKEAGVKAAAMRVAIWLQGSASEIEI
jgi:DNA mismatch endonuclease, patch repair protein